MLQQLVFLIALHQPSDDPLSHADWLGPFIQKELNIPQNIFERSTREVTEPLLFVSIRWRGNGGSWKCGAGAFSLIDISEPHMWRLDPAGAQAFRMLYVGYDKSNNIVWYNSVTDPRFVEAPGGPWVCLGSNDFTVFVPADAHVDLLKLYVLAGSSMDSAHLDFIAEIRLTVTRSTQRPNSSPSGGQNSQGTQSRCM